MHGNSIRVVKKEDAGQGAVDYDRAFAETDALITNEREVLLSSYYADCTPLFFLAPDIPAVGLAHAGWRGTVNKIGQQTAVKMAEVFGADLDELLVGIGPHIGPCCYQVGQDVIDKLKDSFAKWHSLVTKEQGNKWRFDLAAANQIQLEEVGVKRENIITSSLCTCCQEDLFYSYRRDNGQTGRMASLIKIRCGG